MMGKIRTFRELFEMELRYAYDCEQKLVKKGLTSMIEAATSPELRSGLQQHLEERRGHVARLERVFSSLALDPDAKSNGVIDELTKAAKDSVSNLDDGALRDAALIFNGNYVEHYEIAMYGVLVEFARRLGIEEAATLFQQTLNEEKAADAKLTQLAQRINPRAAVQAQHATA